MIAEDIVNPGKYAPNGNKIAPIKSHSELFIYPGYKFNVVNKMLTNFHLPKSTLIFSFYFKFFVNNLYNPKTTGIPINTANILHIVQAVVKA